MTSSEPVQSRFQIPWVNDDLIDYGDVQIELCLPPVLQQRRTVGNRFVLGKNRGLVEAHLAQIGGRSVERIADVGVLQGGSVVLFHKLFSPKKLVGIELSPVRLPSLDEYAARQQDASVVVAHGVNQADGAALDRICATEFGDQSLDLVVDDASTSTQRPGLHSGRCFHVCERAVCNSLRIGAGRTGLATYGRRNVVVRISAARNRSPTC